MTAGPAGRASALDLAPELLGRLSRLLDVPPGDVLPVPAGDVGAARRQWPRRHPLIVLAADAVPRDPTGRSAAAERRLLIHNLAAHLEPGGRLVLVGDTGGASDDPVVAIEVDAAATGLVADPAAAARLAPLGAVRVWGRTSRRTVHDLVADARSRIARIEPRALAARLAAEPDLVVLDTRTPTDRARDGVIAGSHHAPRTTIEWLVDPASGYSLPAITSFDQTIVVVCNEGYSSSLAAATLVELGFTGATDLVGGIAAWRDAGLPLAAPDHHSEEELP